nr:MAG TPA: hypothetical protein [Caudoviricetes sp.]
MGEVLKKEPGNHSRLHCQLILHSINYKELIQR